jgi:hypothetical protein
MAPPDHRIEQPARAVTPSRANPDADSASKPPCLRARTELIRTRRQSRWSLAVQEASEDFDE